MNWRHRYYKWSFPLIVLGILLLSFGLLSPRLGLYFDDWPVITNLSLRSANTFWAFHHSDRPFAAWTYVLMGPLLGVRPLVWQFFSIFVRWLTVLGVWWIMRGLWPERRREAAWVALVFAIFPAFDQQAISVAYSQHWMIYALFTVSIGAMLQAERDKRRFWLWSSLALATMLVHIFSMEYFSGLELLRPLFLLLVAAETIPGRKQQIKYAFKRWLLYLAILMTFVAWRLLIYPRTRFDPNNPDILFELFKKPLATILLLTQYAVQDFLNITIGSWNKALDPATYDLSDRLVLVSLAVALLAGVLAFWYLKRSYQQDDDFDTEPGSRAWARQAIGLGALAVLLGVLPVWLTGRQTTLGLYGSRFALASMFGASLLLVGLIVWLTQRQLARILILSVLIGLAVGFHIRRAEVFNRSWVKQSRFYWQLSWRVPDLKSGASIAADGEMFPYVGRYSTALALNLLYPENLPYPQIGHYFYELPDKIGQQADALKAGESIDWQFRNFHFSGSTHDTVLVYYAPEQGNCLWVIDPTDKDNPDLSELAAGGVEISNLESIQREPVPGNGPPEKIFGPEPKHTWCYFYEKGDLARQFADWQEVAKSGDQAQAAGLGPNNPQEWLPFIEGYAHVGRWEEAIEKSVHVRQVNFRVAPRLCRLWSRVVAEQPVPQEVNPDYQAMLKRLECSIP
jgi:hypothetical protein